MSLSCKMSFVEDMHVVVVAALVIFICIEMLDRLLDSQIITVGHNFSKMTSNIRNHKTNTFNKTCHSFQLCEFESDFTESLQWATNDVWNEKIPAHGTEKIYRSLQCSCVACCKAELDHNIKILAKRFNSFFSTLFCQSYTFVDAFLLLVLYVYWCIIYILWRHYL